jgi:hypothetical protein
MKTHEQELIQTIATALAAGVDKWDIESELEDYNVRTSSGVYRTAFVLDSVVVKMSRDTRRQKMLVKEADFINEMREDEKYARHFPQTEVFKVGNVTLLIQEKVPGVGNGGSGEEMDAVENLAEHLGITDMHEFNYGWKMGKNGKYPVFIDVDLRLKRGRAKDKTKRSWMV